MWKKLSTPALPVFEFHDIGPRGGYPRGEIIVFMAGTDGKSRYKPEKS